jgi:nitroreductase
VRNNLIAKVFVERKETGMFADLVKNRRSIREYEDRPVEQEKIETIIESALRAPSGRGIRPWSFVVVTDRGLLDKLSVAKPMGADFLKKAPVGIVVCAETDESLVWIEDCAIAAVFLQLSAHSLGLGSRWSHMKGNMYDDKKTTRDYIAEILNLPDNLEVECIIAIGYPAESIPPYEKEELRFERVHYNGYGKKR